MTFYINETPILVSPEWLGEGEGEKGHNISFWKGPEVSDDPLPPPPPQVGEEGKRRAGGGGRVAAKKIGFTQVFSSLASSLPPLLPSPNPPLPSVSNGTARQMSIGCNFTLYEMPTIFSSPHAALSLSVSFSFRFLCRKYRTLHKGLTARGCAQYTQYTHTHTHRQTHLYEEKVNSSWMDEGKDCLMNRAGKGLFTWGERTGKSNWHMAHWVCTLSSIPH